MKLNIYERITWGRMNATFNRLPFRGRLLFFVGGCLVGGGGFAGYALSENREEATRPPEADSQSIGIMQPPLPLLSESVKRWVPGKWWWPFPHWVDAVAEMLPHSAVLLLGRPDSEKGKTSRVLRPISGGGGIATAIPLRGAAIKGEEDKANSKSNSFVIEVDTPEGDREFIKYGSAQDYTQWLRELKVAARLSNDLGGKV